MKKVIIGVMGPARATNQEMKWAFELGRLIAEEGWVLLTGGRNMGVMDAASQGAKSADGLTIGILRTGEPEKISKHVDLPIVTGMGNARNAINVLSSDIVITCGTTSSGTLSEIALALKEGKPVVVLNRDSLTRKFLKKIGGRSICFSGSPMEAIKLTKRILKGDSPK